VLNYAKILTIPRFLVRDFQGICPRKAQIAVCTHKNICRVPRFNSSQKAGEGKSDMQNVAKIQTEILKHISSIFIHLTLLRLGVLNYNKGWCGGGGGVA
jgi:hypothetical protein